MSDLLRLSDVRAMFRLIGDLRTMGSDPAQWRTHLVRRLRKILNAAVVVSSEIHARKIPGQPPGGKVHIVDVGWGCDESEEIWRIETDIEAPPQEFMIAPTPTRAFRELCDGAAAPAEVDMPIRPVTAMRTGRSFVLSQCPLPHLGAVDQLGVHKDMTQASFTPKEHRLIQLFHAELGRLWRRDALNRARDPNSELPPRLAQTLAALQAGCSEKQVSIQLGISKHTVHNYVKALHQRLGVSSRGELLAKTVPTQTTFLPQFSVPADR